MVCSSLSEARACGAKQYATGRPCKNGHISPRLASNGVCLKCAALKESKWRKSNKDARKRQRSRYYLKHKEEKLAKDRLYREKNKEKIAARNKRYRAANKEKYAATHRLYAEKNRTRINLNKRRWECANQEKMKASKRRNRARRHEAEGFHTDDDVRRIRRQQRDKCALCRTRLKEGGHVDHIHPLSKGGTDWPSNLQILCASCNCSKHAKDPIIHARSLGLLL